MKTSPDCISCFHRQARHAASLANDSKEIQETIIREAEKVINSVDFESSPPENAVTLYREIARLSDNQDIFNSLKKISNSNALDLQKDLSNIIQNSPDPFETAARLAIAGNIIDYGSQQEFDIGITIKNALTDEPAINNLSSFRKDIENAQHILYLGDNCGELVFDRLFIETISRPVTFAVKEKPVINDAIMEDGIECGLDKVCRIISNGTDCPGTPLDSCSGEFKNIWNKADLIISKGQGNFETLSEIPGPIYFLLMVKCPVVAGHINGMALEFSGERVKIGDMVIMKHPLFGISEE